MRSLHFSFLCPVRSIKNILTLPKIHFSSKNKFSLVSMRNLNYLGLIVRAPIEDKHLNKPKQTLRNRYPSNKIGSIEINSSINCMKIKHSEREAIATKSKKKTVLLFIKEKNIALCKKRGMKIKISSDHHDHIFLAFRRCLYWSHRFFFFRFGTIFFCTKFT